MLNEKPTLDDTNVDDIFLVRENLKKNPAGRIDCRSQPSRGGEDLRRTKFNRFTSSSKRLFSSLATGIRKPSCHPSWLRITSMLLVAMCRNIANPL